MLPESGGTKGLHKPQKLNEIRNYQLPKYNFKLPYLQVHNAPFPEINIIKVYCIIYGSLILNMCFQLLWWTM